MNTAEALAVTGAVALKLTGLLKTAAAPTASDADEVKLTGALNTAEALAVIGAAAVKTQGAATVTLPPPRNALPLDVSRPSKVTADAKVAFAFTVSLLLLLLLLPRTASPKALNMLLGLIVTAALATTGAVNVEYAWTSNA